MNMVNCDGDAGESYESLTRAILEAVADREGTDPVDIDQPLHDVLDPDALNSLFPSTSTERSDGRVEFTYYGYEVTAYGDGRVHVRESDASASSNSAASNLLSGEGRPE